MRPSPAPSRSLALLCLLVAPLAAKPVRSPVVVFKPFAASGIYRLGQRAGWTVTLAPGARAPAGGFTYVLRENDAVPLKSGTLDLAAGPATVATTLDRPAMLYLDVRPAGKKAPRWAAGAAVAPTLLKPSLPRPADFDAFWAAKLKLLHAVPMGAVVKPGTSDRPGVDYATIRMNNFNGAHVYGQLAKPARPGKFPALLILQWASPPYPLHESWVTARAAQGWLALNVEPHDVPGNLPQAFYAALPHMIKHYETIYNDDRDRNYFLQMYLGDCRALDYLKSRPDWNGRTLVLMGTSMGGQQSLCVAGLEPQVTDVIVDVPAGCDVGGALHHRHPSYPDWDVRNPKVLATAPYFDPINFASRIKARCLVAMGFVDETAAPAGIWAAFNLIPGPKQAAPMIASPHNNLATPAEQRPYTVNSEAWLDALVHNRQPAIMN